MKYLLDTCCISDFVKNDMHTIKRLQETSPTEIAISSISAMELEYGLRHNPEKTKKIKPIIQAIISSVTILSYTEQDGKYSAEIRAMMRKLGMPIGAYDVLIAGTAMHHKLIVVTSNEKKFCRIPNLKVENWRK